MIYCQMNNYVRKIVLFIFTVLLFLEPTTYTNSFYGDGMQPIVYSNIQCSGSEDSLNNCDKEKYGDFACSRQNIAGLKCKDGMTNNY